MELYKKNPPETCSIHNGRPNEFYCEDHDAFYCSVCVFKLHKDCSRILAPDEVETFILESKVLLESDIEHLQKEVSKLLNEQMGAYDSVVSTKIRAEEDIKALRDSIEKQLHRLQENTSTTLKYALKQETPKYQNEIKNLRSIQNDLSDSLGSLSKATLHGPNASKRTVEQMRSLIFEKKRFQEISTKVKPRDGKHAILKKVAFNVSAQVQEVLKTLCKLEQLGTISICEVAESKKDTNVATLFFEAEEVSLEVKMNTNSTYTKDADNKWNDMVNRGKGDDENELETNESEIGSKNHATSFDVDSVASESLPDLGANQWKCIQSDLTVGSETKSAILVHAGAQQVPQRCVEELGSTAIQEYEIASENHATSFDVNSEASESLPHLGENQGKCIDSDISVGAETKDTILVPVGTPNVPKICAEELRSKATENKQVEEEATMGCFDLKKTFYTIMGRGEKNAGNMNSKRSRSLPMFDNRTRRQNKEVVVIEDDGSVHILMTN